MTCRRATYLTDLEMIEYYQKCVAEIASLQKLKIPYTTLKNISYGLRTDVWLWSEYQNKTLIYNKHIKPMTL